MIWDNPRLLNTLANLILAGVLLALVGSGVWWLANRPSFALKVIEVQTLAPDIKRLVVDHPRRFGRPTAADGISETQGLGSGPSLDESPFHHLDSETIVKALEGIRGSFFTVSLHEVRTAVKALPWVREVSVRRVFPSGLEIRVEEQAAVAAWRDGVYVNPYGELFQSAGLRPLSACALADLDGPGGSQAEVLKNAVAWNSVLAEIHRQVQSVELSARRSWSLVTDNGMMVQLGRDSPSGSTHQRLVRFVAEETWLTEKEKAGVITSVDLRYGDGFTYRIVGQVKGTHADTKPSCLSSQLKAGSSGTQPRRLLHSDSRVLKFSTEPYRPRSG